MCGQDAVYSGCEKVWSGPTDRRHSCGRQTCRSYAGHILYRRRRCPQQSGRETRMSDNKFRFSAVSCGEVKLNLAGEQVDDRAEVPVGAVPSGLGFCGLDEAVEASRRPLLMRASNQRVRKRIFEMVEAVGAPSHAEVWAAAKGAKPRALLVDKNPAVAPLRQGPVDLFQARQKPLPRLPGQHMSRRFRSD
jgi:hypothetical protein